MTLLCAKCRKLLEEGRAGKYRYCNECHAANMRKIRPKYSELPELEKKKSNCRAHTRYLIKQGKLKKQPCKCGSLNVQAHHPDYNNPALVEWLCRPCHLKEHDRLLEIEQAKVLKVVK